MKLPRLAKRQRELALTDRGRSLLAAGVTLIVAGALLGFVDLVRIGALLVVLPLCALVVSRWGRPALTVRREVSPSPVPAGGSAEVSTLVRHTGRRRCGAALVEDCVRAPAACGVAQPRYQRFAVPALPPDGVGRLRYTVTPARRGRHELGPLRVHVSDAFGLTRHFATVPGMVEFVALTRVWPLVGSMATPEGEESADLAALVVSGLGEPSSTVREYRHGDDPRRIHWSASARTGDLLVRVEEQASARRAVILLDERFPTDRSGNSVALDWAVEALASVASALADSGHVVHLVCDERLDDVRLLDPIEAAEAVSILSCAHPVAPGYEDPGRVRRLREAAIDLAADGGLLVTAVPAHSGEASAVLGGRPTRATGLVFVIEATAEQGEPVSEPGGQADAVLVAAQSGGWHGVTVRPGRDEIGSMWAALASAASRSWA